MASSMLDVASLEPLVDQRDVILVTGKGGTGKSTLVAALAALAVRRRGPRLRSSSPRTGACLT